MEPVKTKRRYDSPRRREQAAATRTAILEAAQRLFEHHGYTATTMAAIAAEAGVSLKTVYVAFATKAGVLRGLWHLLLRGDQLDVPVGERPWYREVLDEPDPARQLRLNARNSRIVKQRAGLRPGEVEQRIRDRRPAGVDVVRMLAPVRRHARPHAVDGGANVRRRHVAPIEYIVSVMKIALR